MTLWELEEQCWNNGLHLVGGTDEAGAGPLAGPVYASAVILPRHLELKWLNDSKRVTPLRREVLFEQIKLLAIDYAIASVDEKTIDQINILNARLLAMRKAVEGLRVLPDCTLVDGNQDRGMTFPHALVVRGDAQSANIAAASILAKVSRDRFMTEMAKKYPQYFFERHKGYPTRLHYQMLDQYGPSPIHRKSFLKKWEARR